MIWRLLLRQVSHKKVAAGSQSKQMPAACVRHGQVAGCIEKQRERERETESLSLNEAPKNE